MQKDDTEKSQDATAKAQEMTENGLGDPPFKEFQQTLAFLASIGLAASTSSAFSLVGVTSSLGDSSDAALQRVRQSALLLSWASSCFIVAIAIIVTTQLLYTEKVIVGIITKTVLEHWQERIVRVGVAVFAWVALGFQTAAILLFAQALDVFSNGSMRMARYGVVGGMGLVLCVTLVGLLSQKQGQEKIRGALHIHDTEKAT